MNIIIKKTNVVRFARTNLHTVNKPTLPPPVNGFVAIIFIWWRHNKHFAIYYFYSNGGKLNRTISY